jgi:hypothetical protein
MVMAAFGLAIGNAHADDAQLKAAFWELMD